MGKGSKPRITDKKKYDENYDAIFKARQSFEKENSMNKLTKSRPK